MSLELCFPHETSGAKVAIVRTFSCLQNKVAITPNISELNFLFTYVLHHVAFAIDAMHEGFFAKATRIRTFTSVNSL